MWWQTGLFFDRKEGRGSISIAAKLNLYFTAVSASITMVAMLFGLHKTMASAKRDGNAVCDCIIVIVFYIPTALIAGFLIFWLWFSIDVIRLGTWQDSTATAVLGSGTGTGSGEAAEALDVAATNATAGDSNALNQHVTGIYVTGMIVAAICIFATFLQIRGIES